MYLDMNAFLCECIFMGMYSYGNVFEFKVLDKRRVDHCLISMEGLAEGQAGARLACGEVDSSKLFERFQFSLCFSIRDCFACVLCNRLKGLQVVPLWFLSEARGTTGSRRRVLPQDLTLLSAPKPHQGADLPDLLDHCVVLGEEVTEWMM